jgi:peroxiredoxin
LNATGEQPEKRPGNSIRHRGRGLFPRLIMAVAAVGLFLLSYQWGSQYKHGAGKPPAVSGVSIRPPQPLPDFALNNGRGIAFGRADLVERWSLLGFAPVDSARGHRSIARMVEVYNRLADQPDLRRQLHLILVTEDSVPRLAADFERLSPAISVLSGEPAELDSLRTALGAGPQPSGPDSAQDLPPLFLIDPDARLAVLFPSPQPAAAVAADVAALARWTASRAPD